MNLRRKLTLGFFVMAVITLIVSGIAYWQTERLSRALYEIGVVRLPSIQALDTIFEAKTALDASKRELMRPESLDTLPTHTLDEELRRQDAAWRRIEQAWALYEPLPRTLEEDAAWKEFVPTWNTWRSSYTKVMDHLREAVRTGDQSHLTAADRENEENLYTPARRSRELLAELIRINADVVAQAKDDSIASLSDMRTVRVLIILGAVASLAGAVACGVVMGRIIGRPITRVSQAFGRIADGDLNTRVEITSDDEISTMSEAMNRMVDSLRTSELRFRALFENTFDAIGVSRGRQIVLGNPAFLKLFGYDRLDDAVDRSIDDFIAPSSLALVEDRIRRRRAGESVDPIFEIEARRKDGSTFTTEVQSSVFMLNGEAHTVAVHRDVTERRRAAAQLADFARRLEVALHTSKLGVWRRHLVTCEARWDERMFEIFGLEPGGAAPSREKLMELIVPEDRDATWGAWNASPSPGTIYSHRFRIIRADGEARHIEVHGMVHKESDKGGDWAIGVAGDVTEIVEAAAQSARLREQLLQAQKMEALGTLSSGIAHDFNNFLTGINGFIDLAKAHLPDDHEAYELLEQAKVAAGSAGGLARRILTFSKQARSSQRTQIDLGRIAVETTALISATLPFRITMNLDVADDLPQVLADAGQLQQVLMNLCTNGVHAIGKNEGEIHIDIRLRNLSGSPGAALPPGCLPGLHVCLSVRDTGCGMDESTLKRIFEPFFTTKTNGLGTGLGLSIVKDIMTAHEGGLEVRSTPGEGTLFLLYFPVAGRVAAAA